MLVVVGILVRFEVVDSRVPFVAERAEEGLARFAGGGGQRGWEGFVVHFGVMGGGWRMLGEGRGGCGWSGALAAAEAVVVRMFPAVAAATARGEGRMVD